MSYTPTLLNKIIRILRVNNDNGLEIRNVNANGKLIGCDSDFGTAGSSEKVKSFGVVPCFVERIEQADSLVQDRRLRIDMPEMHSQIEPSPDSGTEDQHLPFLTKNPFQLRKAFR